MECPASHNSQEDICTLWTSPEQSRSICESTALMGSLKHTEKASCKTLHFDFWDLPKLLALMLPNQHPQALQLELQKQMSQMCV